MKLQHFQILHYGVGVEKVEEALKAIEYSWYRHSADHFQFAVQL
jgi:hypothetical protein